jgi:hypothetical protein
MIPKKFNIVAAIIGLYSGCGGLLLAYQVVRIGCNVVSIGSRNLYTRRKTKLCP